MASSRSALPGPRAIPGPRTTRSRAPVLGCFGFMAVHHTVRGGGIKQAGAVCDRSHSRWAGQCGRGHPQYFQGNGRGWRFMLRMAAHWIGAGLLAGSLASSAAAQELSAIVETVSPPREDVRAFDI